MTTETCAKEVHYGDRHWPRHYEMCGKMAKGQTDEGYWLCGVHLGAYRRRKTNLVAQQKGDAANVANSKRAAVACDLLKELGTEAVRYYAPRTFVRNPGYVGQVVVNPAALFRALGMEAQLPEIQA